MNQNPYESPLWANVIEDRPVTHPKPSKEEISMAWKALACVTLTSWVMIVIWVCLLMRG